MNILGIYGAFDWDCRHGYSWTHDSGATLITNESHQFSISEERFTKRKYEGQFPINSINYCISNAGIKNEDIDLVVCPSMPVTKFYEQQESNLIQNTISHFFPNAKLKIISHHKAHALASIYSSNFNEGSFITLDGAGSLYFDCHGNFDSTENSTIGYFNKSQKIFKFFPTLNWFNNFGHYYQTWAHHIFCQKTNQNIDFYDESHREAFAGKIMGLCAYGNPKIFSNKQYKLDVEGLPLVSFKTFGGDHDEDYLDLSPEDAAATTQKIFEDALIEYFLQLKKENYLESNLCVSGGIFLNILANTKLKNIFPNIHVPPFTSDCGLHYGAAAYGLLEEGKEIKLPHNISLFGKEYSDEEILDELKNHDLNYELSNDIFYETSQYLNANKIIGWFQNRSEFGPRALGSRSILMNPKFKENKDILNERVKHREYWRPFAGIILEEYVQEYFEEGFTSPYMLYSQTVRKEKIQDIAAITHEDNTCRIQTVNNLLHPQITALLKEYQRVSGVPVVLNTSFNDNGQPIVETPHDAIRAFINMDIDYLIIGNYIVSKK